MPKKLIGALRAAPATVPALAAVALFIVWATDQAGYPVTHWGAGGLILLGLLGLTLGAVGLRVGEIPPPVRVALACLAGYTALSFVSILWAEVPGDAWEGANRTLLYLLVFALFACWRQRGASAALLLGAWTPAMIGLAAFVALRANAATGAALEALLPGGRLVYPSGYANANAAEWLMAFWPALLLARSRSVPWGLRGVFGGGAVLLAEVALLSQSRGSLYATPVMLVLVFALLPGRIRTFAVLLPVAAGIGAAAPAVLRAGENLTSSGVRPSAVHAASAAMFAAAAVVGLAVAAGSAFESRGAFSEAFVARTRRALGAVAIAGLLAVLAGGWAAAGDPVARIRHGWDTFKGGYAANATTGSRLTSGLGSNRYDFYRVALNEFTAHPLVGIGADNFQQPYLLHGHSGETPHYPHSVELRTLTETGLAGALLALAGLAGALLAGWRAMRGADAQARAVAAAALSGFAYWAVHGSFDWFWEFAGLGAPAFALLGLACALAPGSAPGPARAVGARVRGRRVALVVCVLGALAAGASLGAPWLSQLEVQSAGRIWAKAPHRAYARLDEAAELNPLSDEPYLLAGSIALRFGDLVRADHEFALALGRFRSDPYATLERGAIASTRGERVASLELLAAAVRADPRDPLAREALLLVRRGRRVSVDALNRSILSKAQQFG